MHYYDDLPNIWTFLDEIVITLSAAGAFPSGLSIILMVMLTLHGMFVLFLTISFHRVVDKYLKPKSIFLSTFFYFIAINMIFVSHFINLLIWTYTTIFFGAIKDPMNAFYFVGEMYTTLGFGQFSVSPQWRILPIIISIGGIFSASISGAALYSMLNALISKSRSESKKDAEGQ